MSGLIVVASFLLSLFFGLVIFALWARLALHYLHFSSLHPFSQLITTSTEPLVKPFKYIVKQKNILSKKYEGATLISLIVVEFLKIISLSLLAFHTFIPVVLLFIYVAADLIIQPCNLLFYAILIRVVMSYINPYWQHPIADFLRKVTEPLLIFGRKLVPDISGFDFSPIIIMIILKVITLFISASLPGNLL